MNTIIHIFSKEFIEGDRKSGTLPTPDMRNTEGWFYLKSELGTDSKLIHFNTPWENIEITINSLNAKVAII